MADHETNGNDDGNESPPDVVQTAYHMAVAAQYMRDAEASIQTAHECATAVRERVVAESDGKIVHMHFADHLGDMRALQAASNDIGAIQIKQCEFNRKVLRNKRVTLAQMAVYGPGGCR